MSEDTNFWSQLMETDEHAAEYMRSHGEGPGFETRMLLSNLINDGEDVLDMGCGPAWNFDHFMEHGPLIHGYQGYDYSERFVRVANQRINKDYPTSAYGIFNTETSGYVKQGDCRAIDEPDESWDVVLLQDCLEHTNGYEKPVTEALRVAKKRVIVSFWHLTEDDDHINDDGNDGWGAWYSRPKWEAFLNTLPYPWMDEVLQVKGKTHKWNFYIIDKEGK